MGIMAYFLLLWVMQDLCHQRYSPTAWALGPLGDSAHFPREKKLQEQLQKEAPLEF